MKYYSIDFKDDPYGICIPARTKEEAIKIVKNPANWKDGKIREIDTIRQEKEDWSK